MAEAKTKKTGVSVESFLDKVADERQRADAYTVLELMKSITGLPPKMWGPSMIGFGEYHYKYESGHEGDCFMMGFAPRKGTLSLYFMAGLDAYAKLLAKLGKHTTGKTCLYVKKLEDIDLKVLRTMIEKAYSHTNGRQGSNSNEKRATKKESVKKPGKQA
jgi:hypothetical protein